MRAALLTALAASLSLLLAPACASTRAGTPVDLALVSSASPPLDTAVARPSILTYPEDDDEDGGTDGLSVDVFYVPVVTIDPDVDEDEPNLGIELEADLRNGSGVGASVAWLDEGDGFGVLYVTSDHRERELGGRARTHALYLESLLAGSTRLGFGRLTYGVGLGVGFAGIDFDRGFDDGLGLAGEVRAKVGLGLGDHLSFEVGGGLFRWGYPGETVADGAFVTAGMSVRL